MAMKTHTAMSTDIRQQIKTALLAFSGSDPGAASIGLLDTLGYQSEKTLDLVNTPDAFLAEFDKRDRKFRKDKTLFERWKTIEFLFQITDHEVRNSGAQAMLFDSGYDHGNYQSYLFFALDLEKNHYTRTQMADITREINLLFDMPVMLLIRHNGALTFSVIDRRLHKKDQSRDVLEKVKLIKDIRYQDPHRAHMEILYDLALPTLMAKHECRDFKQLHEAWRKTLDSSELNKRFFREVANWYFWAVRNVTFPKDAGENVEIRNATSVIRMITRFIFVWFIKEKGLVPDNLFEKTKVEALLKFNDPHGSTYYKAILQNLFFATLNREMNTRDKKDKRDFRSKTKRLGGRDQHYMIHNVYRYKDYFTNPEAALDIFSTIPFLNGGLFECLDRENKNKPKKMCRIDGFSDRKDNELVVPDFLFFSQKKHVDLNQSYGTKNKQYEVRGLINILDSYKFTINENTPIEEDVALDPELLGKVFENLLASYNPETGATARKQTGSFYTPREIVGYMVDESLKAALSKLVFRKGIDSTEKDIEAGLDILFAYTEKAHAFSHKEIAALVEAIAELNILDPACGSGAFPMGALHKLVYILRKIDPDNTRWRDLQKQRAIKETEQAYSLGDKEERHQRLGEIEDAFNFNTSDYGRKLYLIENCIYGIDIQPIAVQIAKLRFFISLVVDQNVDAEKDNYGIRPLPNLETKFVAADTLIGIERPDQNSFVDMYTKELEKELLGIRHKHFNAKTLKTKRKYREKDRALRKKIAQILKDSGWSSAVAEQLAGWEPYRQNRFAPFFDPEWMFGIKDGFDIVIGNPPYVQIQKFSGKQEQKDWEKQGFATYVKTGDVYCLFYEKGNMLLRDKGILAYITSNKWMRANYGKKTRKYFTEKTNPLVLLDFGGHNVFESATVDTNILIFEKNKNRHSTNACAIGKDYSENISISDYMTQHSIILDNLGEESWIISSKDEYAIKKRIEDIGAPLKDWDVSIYYGIKTGFNEAFIIDGAKRNELIAADPKNTEIIKPILRGRDIKRYKTESSDWWLINTHNGYGTTPPINIDDYPTIKKYLDRYYVKLKKRQDKGGTPYHLRNCAYLHEFEKEKIAWGNLALHSQFSLIQKGQYINAPSPFITSGSKYLLSVLNSSLGDHYIRLRGVTRNGGYFEYKPMFIEHVPIPKIPSESQKPFEILVDCILFAKENNMESEASTLESVIDGMVYDLYFEEEMKKANCFITDRIKEVIKPFKDDDTDDFKKLYIEKLVTFCNEDKIVYRGLIYRRTVKVVKIVTGAKK